MQTKKMHNVKEKITWRRAKTNLVSARHQIRPTNRGAGGWARRQAYWAAALPTTVRVAGRGEGVFLIFIYFFKKIYRNIFSVLDFTVLYPYRPAGGRQGGGRDLFANKNKIYLRINPWWGPAAPLPGGRPLPPSGGAAGTCI